MRGLAHHRSRFLVAFIAVLYGALWTCTSLAQSTGADASSGPPPVPHLALLLPLNGGPFVPHAQAVRDGFIAAAKVQGDLALPLRVYASTDDPEVTVGGYRQAVAAGARLVVGPLTRAAVSALAATNLVPVTTLALNAPDGGASLPPHMYVLTLQVDAEAKLVAKLAYEEGHRRAYTVTGTDPLSRRMSAAFVEEFTRLGGVQADGRVYDGSELAGLDQYRANIASSNADAVFLALDAARGRAVRPYLGSVPVYATSQIYPGTAGDLAAFELNDVRFVGMPWLLQPDHAAVMVYPRPDYGGNLDLQRLYALGIDAFRAARELLAGRRTFALDGVTGGLTLGADRIVRRALPVAQLTDGRPMLVGEVQP
jgi:outer membrane PBP1 activator LpoA protein